MARTQKILSSLAILAIPLVGYAAAPTNFSGFVSIFLNILNMLVPIIVGLAFVVFLWGIVKFVGAGGDTEKIREGKNVIVYGIVGLFVMVSVWGLVNVLVYTFFPAALISPP